MVDFLPAPIGMAEFVVGARKGTSTFVGACVSDVLCYAIIEGATDYIGKPETIDEIMDMYEEYIRQGWTKLSPDYVKKTYFPD